MKQTVVILAVLLATACGGSSPKAKVAPTPSPSPTATHAVVANGFVYTDPDGFAITYPKTWERQTKVSGLSVVGFLPETAASDFHSNIGVIFEKTPVRTLTVKQYLDASIANAGKLITNFHLVTRSTQEVAGVKQGILDYTGTTSGKDLHFLALVEVSRGIAYTVTYTATPETFDTYRSEAVPVMESLRIT